MAILLYFLTGLVILFVIVYVIGVLLPEERKVTRQSIFKASPDIVYSVVTNNEDWNYRTDLRELQIIAKEGDIEIWDEIAKNGNVIRFTTREKIPYSFYSFDMESNLFTGYWTANFIPTDSGDTAFIATEYLRIKNPFIKVFFYLFFDVGKFMEIYQTNLRLKIVELK